MRGAERRLGLNGGVLMCAWSGRGGAGRGGAGRGGAGRGAGGNDEETLVCVLVKGGGCVGLAAPE